MRGAMLNLSTLCGLRCTTAIHILAPRHVPHPPTPETWHLHPEACRVFTGLHNRTRWPTNTARSSYVGQIQPSILLCNGAGRTKAHDTSRNNHRPALRHPGRHLETEHARGANRCSEYSHTKM